MTTSKRGGQVALLVSPAAERIAGLSDLLRSSGFSVAEQISVRDVDVRRPQGMRWRRRGYTALVAAGGDGTVGAAVAQLAGSDLPLGILPLGTSNDVARSLGIPLDLSTACAIIAKGVTADVDVGLVIPARPSSQAGGNFQRSMRSAARRLLPPGSLRMALAGSESRFIHAATLGLNVEFARLATDVARRRRWGPFNYATATMEALTRLHPVPVTLRLAGVHSAVGHVEQVGSQAKGQKPAADTLSLTCQVIQVAVVNTPVFGGAFNLRLPAAHPRDRLLDIVVIEALEPRMLRETVERLFASLGALANRAAPHAQSVPSESAGDAEDTLLLTEEAARFALPGVRHYQAQSVRIKAPTDIEITLDGEIAAHTPADVRLARERQRVFLPAAEAGA